MKILLLPLALLLLPVMLGSPWLRLLPERRGLRLLVCWPLGYFLMLALFEVLAVPYTWFRNSFYDLAPAYAWVLAAAAGCSCLAAWILSLAGFGNLVGIIYPLFGWLGIPCTACLLWRSFPLRRGKDNS